MFKIVHDLSTLSETERAQYCRDFSVYLGLNPDENRIDTIWMTDNNIRSLVAYCRRGTTDLLRDIHNIEVLDMVREDGPGYVSFKAIGVNRRGRKDVAIGAYATAGLTGDRLAAAVATAETRAGRRLTLKFMGGGLLDESEVNREPIQTSATTVAAPAAQPIVKIIEATVINHDKNTIEHEVYTPESELAVDLQGSAELLTSKRKGKKGFNVVETEVTSEPLDIMSPLASVEAVNAIIAKETTLEPPVPAKPRGRPRKRKNAVDLGPSLTEKAEPKSPNADIPESQPTATPEKPVQQLVYVPVCPDCKDFMSANDSLDLYICSKHGRVDTAMKPSVVRNSTAPKPVETPVPVAPEIKLAPVSQSPLTPDQQKSVKTRLSTFWVYTLPEQGGMTSDDGLSINAKLIKYANSFYPDSPNSEEWTFEQWDNFIKSLEKYNTDNGPKALVEHINQRINAA